MSRAIRLSRKQLLPRPPGDLAEARSGEHMLYTDRNVGGGKWPQMVNIAHGESECSHLRPNYSLFIAIGTSLTLLYDALTSRKPTSLSAARLAEEMLFQRSAESMQTAILSLLFFFPLFPVATLYSWQSSWLFNSPQGTRKEASS